MGGVQRRNTCPKCRALLERGTRFCPYCGTDTRHLNAPSEQADAEGTSHFGLWILCLNLAVFAAAVVLDPLRGERPMMSPSGEAWIIFGSCSSYFVHHCGQWWRYLTAIFLHANLLHLVLNSVAILVVLPLAAHALGAPRTIVIYLISGVGGFVVSAAVHPVNAAGASGAVCGLIGALLAWGHRRGGMQGDAVKRQMLTWAAYLVILGFILRDQIDNWGHAGGFGTGLLLGWLASRVSMRGGAEDRLWRTLATVTVSAAVAVTAVFAVPSTVRGLDRRAVEIHNADLSDALDRIEAVVNRKAAASTLPTEVPAGPGDSEALRAAIRKASEAAAANPDSPDTRRALDRAQEGYYEWRNRAVCRYSMLGLGRD